MIKRKYILKLTRRGLTGLFLLITAGAIWVFVLGIYVGRNSVPVSSRFKDIKAKLASLKSEDEKRVPQKKNNDVLDQKKGLDFYEDLKRNNSEDNQKKDHRDRTEDPGVRKAEKDTSGQKPADVSEKKYTIQVASVKDEKTADRIVAELKREGYPVYKTDVTIPDLGRWFRIRVGHYSSEGQAASAIEGLKKKTFKPILLQE